MLIKFTPKKIIIFLLLIVLLGGGLVSIPIVNKLIWENTKKALADLNPPFQLGLTKTVITPCVPVYTGTTCVCTPVNNLCAVLPCSSCPAYSNVQGLPANTDPIYDKALVSKAAIMFSGLIEGGQAIIFGASPTYTWGMASYEGCYDETGAVCSVAKKNKNSVLAFFNKFNQAMNSFKFKIANIHKP